MLRVLRRHSPTQLEVATLEPAALGLWAERGYLRRGDLCSVPDLGTLTPTQLPPLAAPLARGRRRDAQDLLVAALLATAAGLAVKLGGTSGGLASVPLVAAAHLWLQRLRWRREVSLEALPTTEVALDQAEALAQRQAVRSAAARLGTVALIGLTACLPVGLFARFGLAALTAAGVRRLWNAP
ncbi:MAG: hypothetical protein M3Y59_05225 [Myxococcota bacterium]|nr:hypothetical protein [Myxococcota bacterium]